MTTSYYEPCYEDPCYNDEYQMMDDMVSISTAADSLTRQQKNQRRKMMNDLKKSDKGYFSGKRKINGKNKNVDFYATGNAPGTIIRDAITGTRISRNYVGKSDEYMFFKVRLATGENGDKSNALFYNNPSDYEKHNGVVLDDDTRKKWNDMFVAETFRRNREMERENEYRYNTTIV
jgi:hypothetical protein